MAKKDFKNQWYRHNPDDLIEFYQMYDSGRYYIKEIAEWFGISEATARNYIKERERRKSLSWKRKISHKIMQS